MADQTLNTQQRAAKVPPAENGSHAHSPAAHLGTSAQPNSKPADNGQFTHAGTLREPPSLVQRSGKQHR